VQITLGAGSPLRAGSAILVPLLLLLGPIGPARGRTGEGAGTAAPAWADTGAFHWPCEVRPGLSSSFGEVRPRRFHAGIDLKTNGRTGYRVFAIEDGAVYRLRTSPYGYGKAIYLRTRDGRVAVYAHLSGFVPGLTRLLRGEQARRGRYTVDLRLGPDAVPVRRGDVLGWSGQSGVGAPHLHFELRDGEATPVNPQLHGFRVPDRKAPSIGRLLILPLGRDGRVGGAWEPTALAPGSDSPLVSGTFGLAVEVRDQTGTNRHVLAPFRVALEADGEQVFERRLERYRYEQDPEVLLEYHAPSAYRGDRYLVLFRKDGNTLPGRTGPGGLFGRDAPGGGAALEPGTHALRVVAEDVAGNRSEASWTLRYAEAPAEGGGDAPAPGWAGRAGGAPASGPDLPAGKGSGPADAPPLRTYGELLFRFRDGLCYVELRTDRPLRRPPRFVLRTPGPDTLEAGTFGPAPGPEGRTFSRVLVASDLPAGGRDLAVVASGRPGDRLRTVRVLPRTPALPGRRLRVDSPEGTWSLRVEPGDLLEPVFLGLRELEQAPAAASPELVPVGGGVRVEPPWAPLRGAAVLAFEPSEEARASGEFADDRSAVYWYNEQKRAWSFSHREGPQGGSGGVRRLGTFALFDDRTPPQVGDLRIDGKRGSRARPASVLSVAVDDGGSGLEEEGLRAGLDGQSVIAEWDPERKTLKLEPWEPLEPGDHVFSVSIRDRVDNETRRSFSFTVR
jgi:hypothetical protein